MRHALTVAPTRIKPLAAASIGDAAREPKTMKTEAQMRAIWAEDARTHPDTRGGMIAAYFAKGGRITQCPTRFVVVTRQAKGAR